MAKGYVPYIGPVVTRADAKATGLTRFFTGKPCKHSHLSERTTCNGGCIACNAISIRDLYYAEGPAERKARQARTSAWKAANREQVRAEGRAYSKAHREQGQAWKVANRDKLNALEREARAREPERFQKYADTYRINNPETSRVIVQNRRARRLAAEGSHTATEIKTLFAKQKGKCVYCQIKLSKGYDIDHIQPLSKGGSNWITNIQLLCGPCNNRKWATDPLEYARRLGRLL